MNTRILFVDDDHSMLEGLKDSLHKYRKQWSMSFVQSGEQAVEALESETFDVIVCDMRMPGMDGVKVLKEVKNRFPGVIRIILSGYAEERNAVLSSSLAHRYVSKPCDTEQLHSAIESTSALKYLLDSGPVQKMVGGVGRLPTSIQKLNELQSAANGETLTVDAMVDVVHNDIATTAKLLQVVNSAFFRRVREVTTLRESIVYLGVDISRSLVIAEQLARVLASDSRLKESTLNAIQEHSMQVAIVAKRICPPEINSDTAFSAAILSRVGALLTLDQCSTEPEILWQSMQDDFDTSLEVEEAELRTNHLVVGGCLLQLWGLPYQIVNAVACQRHPIDVSLGCMNYDGVLHLSNALVHHFARGGTIDDDVEFLDHDYLFALGEIDNLGRYLQIAAKTLGVDGDALKGAA